MSIKYPNEQIFLISGHIVDQISAPYDDHNHGQNLTNATMK